MPRLDKLLSDAGVASRKELKTIIKAGRVTVDGDMVTAPETKVAETARVAVDGREVGPTGPVWLLLHKPAGYVTSTEDPRDKTVMELLPAEYVRRGVFPVGRLDKETEGLLLFTNDGPAAHRILSPKHRVDKVYYAEHDGEAGEADVEAFRAGMVLRDGSVCRPAVLEPLDPGKSRITVQEGMYHQVRRMMAARGLHVNYLRREREADLTLDGVPIGTFRLLTPEEIQHLG
jgi:16S rRNA pseudouridine516 synthase